MCGNDGGDDRGHGRGDDRGHGRGRGHDRGRGHGRGHDRGHDGDRGRKNLHFPPPRQIPKPAYVFQQHHIFVTPLL